jgi:hypothetical protein
MFDTGQIDFMYGNLDSTTPQFRAKSDNVRFQDRRLFGEAIVCVGVCMLSSGCFPINLE